MWLNDFIFDVGDRIGVEKMNGPRVVRTLNRVYRALNSEYKCLVKPLVMDFSTLPTFAAEWDRPADLISVLRIEPQDYFLLPNDQVVLEGEDGTTTSPQAGAIAELAGKFYFNGVTASDIITFWYLSTGLEFALKKDAALTAGVEINEPEYGQTWMWDGLLYAVALELAPKYPLRDQDERNYARFVKKLRQNPYRLNQVTPESMGGAVQPVRDDGYGPY
jgi:hypothetical protein